MAHSNRLFLTHPPTHLPKLGKLGVRRRVVTEEELFISGISLHPTSHAGCLEQSLVGDELEEGRVGVLGHQLL